MALTKVKGSVVDVGELLLDDNTILDESIYSFLTRNIVEAKLLSGSDKGATNKTILETALSTGRHVVVNGSSFTINGPIDITKSNGVTFSGMGICTITKGNDQPLFRLYSNYAFVEGFDCAGYVSGTETTDTIIIGENDGANGQNTANGQACIAQFLYSYSSSVLECNSF